MSVYYHSAATFSKITDMKLSVSVKSIMAVPGPTRYDFLDAPPIYTTYLLRRRRICVDAKTRQGKKAAAIEIADQPDTSFLDGKVTAEALKRLDKLSKSEQPLLLAVGYIKLTCHLVMPKKYWDIYRNKSFIRKEAEDKQPIHAPVISFHNWEELRGYTDIPKHGNLSIEKQEELCKAY
ncbi:MAG: hypothetical protein ACLR6J_05600 [Parabacteroides merdae]